MVKFIKIYTTAVLVFFCGAAAVCSEISWQDDGSFSVSRNGRQVKGFFTVTDGESNRKLPVKGRVSGDTLTWESDGIRWNLKASKADRLTLLEGLLENRSGRERRLEPALTLIVEREDEDRYYEGFNLHNAEDELISRVGIKGKPSKHIGGGLNPPFPVSALFNSKRAVFAGQLVDEAISHNSSFYYPEGKTARLVFAQRMVPADGQKIDFRFVIGTLPIRFGAEENIVQSYYDAFPERFRPVVPMDNWLIRGAHSHYRAYIGKPDPEQERRYYASIEWAYAPFKRSGDSWGHDEFWNYKPLIKPARPIEFNMNVNGSVLDYNKMSAKEYREARKKIFERWGERLGYAYYSCPGWCEINLAKEHYPDSINYDRDGGVKTIINGWVQQHDREIRVFPLSTTSMGKAARRDLKRLAEELSLDAFTLDCGASGIYYRGPAASDPASPGRAWDEKGLFIDELVAANEIIDYVHSLRPENPIVVWKNGPGRGDMKMIESGIFHPIFRSWMPQTRYNTGMRPTVLHSRYSYLINDTIPNWRKLDRESFYRELAKLGDHAVLTGFRYGVTQSDRCCDGNPQLLYCMPELLEVVKLGWQPLFPVAYDSGNKFLYRACYGRRADTVLFLGNPWEKPMKLELRVDNCELAGDGMQLFVRKMRDHAETLNRVDKSDTVFDVVLPVRRPALFEAVCTLWNLPENFSARVCSAKDINRISFTVEIKSGKPFASRIVPRNIAGFTLETLTVDGRELSGETRLAPGQKIVMVYRSNDFVCNKADILSFPFVQKKIHPRFAIVLPPDARDYEKREAEAIKDYFRFTFSKKITAKPSLPYLTAVPDKTVPAVVFRRGACGIRREGNHLIVQADDMRSLRRIREKLQFVMDERFPWIFPFKVQSDLPKEIFRKFDMGRRHLPWSRCFESGVEK